MGDASEVEDGIEIFERVEAGVIAERALAAQFVEVDVAFEHNFARSRYLEVYGFALDQIDRRSAEKAGDQVFLDLGRRGNNRRKRHCGFGADGNRDLHLPGRAIAFGNDGTSGRARHDVDRRRLARDCCPHTLARVFGRNFLTLPVHSSRTFVEDLHPVHAEVALAGLGIARGDARESDEPSRILGPALENREIEQ